MRVLFAFNGRKLMQPTSSIPPSHYIIGRAQSGSGPRLFFGKVQSRSGTILEGYIEKDAHVSSLRVSFEIPVKDVVLDLGTNPHPGSVYGFDTTNRFFTRKVHDFFGPICFFYKPDKAVAKKIFDAFDAAAKIIQKAGFDFPAGISVWEIVPKESKGKWAGYFRKSKKPETNPHRFSIKPESAPDSEWVYIILHEFSHYLHSSAMTGAKLNAAWIKLFNTSIRVRTIRKELSISLLENLVAGEDRPSDFKSSLDEDGRNAYNWILRTIKADHSVSIRELDTLFEADSKDEISNLWPQRTLHHKDLQPIVSEYATTAVHELIAESLAFYWTRRKLPSSITKLVEKSLSFAKANQEKTQ